MLKSETDLGRQIGPPIGKSQDPVIGLGKGKGYDVNNKKEVDVLFSAEPQDPNAPPRNTGGYHPAIHGPLKGEKKVKRGFGLGG